MNVLDDDVVLQLDRVVRSPGVLERINDALRRTAAALRDSDRSMTWEVIPLDLLESVPRGVRSCWVFMLRASQDTGAERHPNSHQRSLSLVGSGGVELREDGEWRAYSLVSGDDASPAARWASIPPDTWHRWQVGARDWAVLSFHTVAAGDLIEERPVTAIDLEAGPTAQNRYL